MASTLKHLRSSTADKRPAGSGLADGQLAINTASGTPGLFFKDSNGAVVKVGPAHVGAAAPNAVPAGSTGNAKGELWVDNSLTTAGLKYYTGSAFVNLTPSGTESTVGLVELATAAETQTGTDAIRAVTPSGLQSKISDSISTTSSTTIASATAVKTAYDLANAALPKAGGTVSGEILINPSGSLVFEGSSNDSFQTTLAVTDPTADRTITFPNVTGTVVTTGDTGSITSTMIADGTIVNVDVNASAAIDGTKISPNFGSQNTTTTGTSTAASFIPTSSGVPTNGLYLPSANNVAVATNGVGRITIDGSGNVNIDSNTLYVDATNNRVGIGTTSPVDTLQVNRNSTSAAAGAITIKTADSNESVLSVGVSTSLDTAFISSLQNGTGTARPISFVVGSSSSNERMRIDTSGRLLVGTSTSYNVGSPGSATLQAVTTSTVPIGSFTRYTNDNDGAIISLGKSRGTSAGSFTVVQSGDIIGNIRFAGADGGDLETQAASIRCEVDGTPGANDMPGRLVFSTTADGASSPTERLRITSTGQVRLAGAGITFNGDTATANELDDYEEGTFTPTIVGTTDAGTGTYTIQTGVYTKVGNAVHYAITILWTAHTGTGNMRIDGLPFTARNLTNYNPSVSLDMNNLTSPASTIVTGIILSNTTLIGLNTVPIGGGARAALTLDTAGTIWASGSYTV